MPSTGTPCSKTACGARAVSSSVAEAWLPERMMPRGANSRMKSAPTSCGWSSQYTPLSRTRLAMSWVTWEPKSRMRILSSAFERPSGAAAPLLSVVATAALFDVVIGSLFRDLHVVDVGLAHAGGGDLDEFRARP